MNRRTILKGGLALAATSHTAVAVADARASVKTSVDDFLAEASASERVTYHAEALTAAMREMHPGASWRSHINHEHNFCLIIGDEREESR